MRILQLIDSLEAGGAERMAINYANALSEKIEFSGLAATRKEGALKTTLLTKVHYLFLEKKAAIDIKALFKLRSYVKNNRIEIIHAHSSSFFIAVLLKISYPRIRIVWHDHYGSRYLQHEYKNLPLKLCSLFFSKVLTINFDNKKWLEKVLFIKEIKYFPNFIVEQSSQSNSMLKGHLGKRIVFLANLRKPKNHLQFIKAFHKSESFSQQWSIHLIGKDYHDEYSENIKKFVEENQLQRYVFLYGSKIDTYGILKQADIGVLCSTNEGFPVALLEYGYAKLAVLSTNAGFCASIICDGNNGYLFSPSDEGQIISKLNMLTQNSEERITFGENLYKNIIDNYTSTSVIEKYLKFIQ